ncbi:NUMOD1 domain-containing DNA-binding protein [Flavobacterium aquiphilum]|uniref:NUMOD1 domain-containing DNA-binding protein n=1 Tax=Flavobacterium aquiphilum TaxID=3003261 RepID=UPI002480EDE6|nr:NUMOD1 domain-containing DNA-binding protein [Flavobacterium aquiphilum]
MEYSIIYKAENTFTGEVYIGATTKSLEERKQDHLQKSNKKVGSYFQEAIGTYGPEAFNWEQLDTAVNPNELAQKESKYIYDFKAQEEGYNSDRGGGIQKNIYQFDRNSGVLVATYDNLENAAISVSAKAKSISNACLGYNKSCKGFYWSYSDVLNPIEKADSRIKSVSQYSMDEDFIEIFESASEASRKTGVSKTCITRCCRGEREQSGGFLWEYI